MKRKSGTYTLTDFYMDYPYKKREEGSYRPYIPVDQDTNERMSLTYRQWRDIIITYFKLVAIYLFTGRSYRFSSGIGEIEIVKKKSYFADFDRMIKEIMEDNPGMTYNQARSKLKGWWKRGEKGYVNRGWFWKMIWRKRNYLFKFARHWDIKVVRDTWHEMNEYFVPSKVKDSPYFKPKSK